MYCLLLPVFYNSFFACQTFHWPLGITIACHCGLFFMPVTFELGNDAPASLPNNDINKGIWMQEEHKIFTWRNRRLPSPTRINLSLCPSFRLSVRAKRGIWSKRVLIRKIGNFFFQRALKEYYDYSVFSTCTESSQYF